MSNRSVRWMWRGVHAMALVLIVLLAWTGVLSAQGPTGPVPAAGTTSVVVLSDDFSGTCKLQKENSEKRTKGCDNGEYTITNKVEKGFGSALYADEYPDSVVQVDARVVSGKSNEIEYGLDFRETADGSITYEFNIDPVNGEYNVALYSDEKYTDLIPYTPSSAIKQGTAVNRLTVFTRGDSMAFFVNGQFVDVATDSTGSNWGVGFHTYVRDPNIKIAFDNMTVWNAGAVTGTLPSAQPTTRPGLGTGGTTAPPTVVVPPTATPASTSKYQVPPGKAGLLVVSFVGKEINFTIAGKLTKIPPNGESFIVVDPGKQNLSANVPGLGDLTDTLDLKADQIFQYTISAGG